nr:retrovirus-related Pol polyprotein from transposon TNT 1-94 [Tanacetum cinerariifolium]
MVIFRKYTVMVVCQIVHCTSGLLFLIAGKENEVNIFKSIDEGPFQIGMLRETLAEGEEGAFHLGSELTKEDRESQLYDDFEHFRQHKGETIHDYYVRFAKLINDMQNIKMTMSRMQLNSKFVNNMLPEWGRFVTTVKLNRGLRDSNYDQLYAYLKQHEAHANEKKIMLDRFTQNTVDPLALMSNVSHQQYYSQSSTTPPSISVNRIEVRGTMHGVQVQLVMGELRTELGMQIQFKYGRLSAKTAMENGVTLDEEQLLFIADDDCDAFYSEVDEAPTAQTMFMKNLSSADPVYDEDDPSYKSDILFEVHDHDHYQDVVYEHHEYVKDNAMPVVQSNVSYVPNDAYMMILNDMHEQPAQHVSVTTQNKPALYNGHEIIKTNRVPAIVHNSEETLKIAEITRKKMNDKMKDPECSKKKVKIAPHDYSKENCLATFTPQKQLTHEHIFWSKDLFKMKEEALKEHTIASRPIKALTVKHDEIERKNLLIANDNLIVDCLSRDVFYTATDSVLTVFRFSDMHEALSVAQKRIAELEYENSNLQTRFKMTITIDAVPIHDLKALDSQNKELHAKVNALHDLNERWWAENEKVKWHYKELYDSIQITRAKTIDKTNSLITEVANLKAHITEHHKSNCVTMPAVKPKVLATGMYVIDVEPIPPRNRNNREVHLDYLKHLKESVATLREIVEDARVEKPFDSSLASAYCYTKHSQKLVEYVIGTCPNNFNKGDKQIASTPVTRKKQVTLIDPCETSTNNTFTHVKQQTMHQTNEPVIPST